MQNNKKLQRTLLRTYMRSIRNNLSFSEKYIAAQIVTNKIISNNYINLAKNIAIFISFDGEINTKLLIKHLLLMNKKIYLPIIPNLNSQCLSFCQYTLSTPLIRNRFNIYEPKKDNNSIISTQNLDIIFVPIVAFDEYGNRLGMGSGFYDKTLQIIQKYHCIIIGLAYDFQKIPAQLLLREKWDIALPEIITPSCHWNWDNNKTYENSSVKF